MMNNSLEITQAHNFELKSFFDFVKMGEGGTF